jgi:hypothetical protein
MANSFVRSFTDCLDFFNKTISPCGRNDVCLCVGDAQVNIDVAVNINDGNFFKPGEYNDESKSNLSQDKLNNTPETKNTEKSSDLNDESSEISKENCLNEANSFYSMSRFSSTNLRCKCCNNQMHSKHRHSVC